MHEQQYREPVRFATAIRAARREAGLSQVKLAAAVGVTGRAVQFYESGDRQPKATILARIALVTGKPLEWFFQEEVV